MTSRPHRTRKTTAGAEDLMIRVGVPHDRYTVAFHVDSCQMRVIDTDGQPRGPYLSSRQAWQIANDLNTDPDH
jgi:hypothetical protein